MIENLDKPKLTIIIIKKMGFQIRHRLYSVKVNVSIIFGLAALSTASADLMIGNVTGVASGGSPYYSYVEGTPDKLVFFGAENHFSFDSTSTANVLRIKNIQGKAFDFGIQTLNVTLTGVANDGGLDFQSISVTSSGVATDPAFTLTDPSTLSIDFVGSQFDTAGFVDVAFSTTAVPEPSAFFLSVIVGFPVLARRRRRLS
jgi:hypothetical protein